MTRAVACALIIAAVVMLTSSARTADVATEAAISDYWDLVAKTIEDPGHFSSVCLGHEITDDQRRIKQALQDGHRKIMAPSAHGVGKSFILADIVLHTLTCPHSIYPDLPPDGDVRVILLSRTGAQLSDVMWREVRTQYRRSPVDLGGRMLEREGWKISENRAAVLLCADDPEAVQGKHAALQVVIVDEGNKVPKPIWDALNSLATGIHNYMVVCLNPVVSAGYCYEMAKRRDIWKVVPISGLDHPNVVLGREAIPGAITREWIEGVLAEKCGHEPGSLPWAEVVRRIEAGEYLDTGGYVMSRVLGRFPKSSSDQFIGLHWIEEAAAKPIVAVEDGKHIGVDAAWMGDDETALAVLDNLKLTRLESWQGERGDYSASRIINVAKAEGIKQGESRKRIHVEKTGVGASTCDHMRRMGWPVDEVDPGNKRTGKEWNKVGDQNLVPRDIDLANRKAYLWWAARELFQRRYMDVPEKFGQVWQDLTAPKIKYDQRGNTKVESKAEVKKRLGRSPDHGEAVITALSRGGGAKVGVIWVDV